jgi:hypothetical protein
MVGLQEKKIENRFFHIASFLDGVPLKTPYNAKFKADIKSFLIHFL